MLGTGPDTTARRAHARRKNALFCFFVCAFPCCLRDGARRQPEGRRSRARRWRRDGSLCQLTPLRLINKDVPTLGKGGFRVPQKGAAGYTYAHTYVHAAHVRTHECTACIRHEMSILEHVYTYILIKTTNGLYTRPSAYTCMCIFVNTYANMHSWPHE